MEEAELNLQRSDVEGFGSLPRSVGVQLTQSQTPNLALLDELSDSRKGILLKINIEIPPRWFEVVNLDFGAKLLETVLNALGDVLLAARRLHRLQVHAALYIENHF